MDTNNNKKRIAIVGLNIYPIPSIKGGAIERGMTELIEQNDKNHQFDFTVYTVTDKDLDDISYKYTKIVQISEKGFLSFVLLFYRAIRKLLRNRIPLRTIYMTRINRHLLRNNYDVVYFATSNELVAQVDRRLESKILYGVYSDYLRKESYGIDIICNRITAFVANPYIQSRLLSELQIPKEKTRIMIGGFDIHPIAEEDIPKIRTTIRNQYNINNDDVLVVYTGRLSQEKGPLELIKAIKLVPECKLILVGGSNFSKNEMTDYIKQLHAEADKCEGRVVFTGYVPDHNDVYRVMASADIGVVPSICNEAGSAALLEFRFVKVPTVYSNKGGMPYYAGRGSLAVECDDDYVHNLAEGIRKLANDSELRRSMSIITREGLEEYSSEADFSRFMNMINNL